MEELQAEQEQARQEILDNSSQLANLQNEQAFLAKAFADGEQALQQAQQNIAALQSENQEIGRLAEQTQAELAGLQQSRAQNKNSLLQQGQTLDEMEARIVQANEANVAVRMKLNSEESRLKILTEMAENKSGLSPGVRAVLRARQQGRPQMAGVLGVVLDLIESDVQYSLALEAAVGAGLQNIVVQDDRAARACVAYLKQEKLGGLCRGDWPLLTGD